jgi:hypothetical protein
VSTGATLLDSHTVAFTLSGQFNNSGAVNVSLAAGAIKNKSGQAVPGYSDKVFLTTVVTPTTPTTPNPVVTTPPITPVVIPPSTVPTTPEPAPSPVTPAPAPSPTPVVGGKTPTRRPTPVKNTAAAVAANRAAAAARVAAQKSAAAAKLAAQRAARSTPATVTTRKGATVRRTPPSFTVNR